MVSPLDQDARRYAIYSNITRYDGGYSPDFVKGLLQNTRIGYAKVPRLAND